MTEFPSGVKSRLPFQYTVPNRFENYNKKCNKKYNHHSLSRNMLNSGYKLL